MDSFKNIINLKPKAKVYSKEQALADEIWQHFSKGIPFGRLMMLIKRNGYQYIYECFNEVRHTDASNHIALFLWKIKQTKVELKDINK